MWSFSNEVCLAACEVMLGIVKLLRSEAPAGVGGTLHFTSCVNTMLLSGIAAASLGRSPNFTKTFFLRGMIH